jgi:hypothetical protein
MYAFIFFGGGVTRGCTLGALTCFGLASWACISFGSGVLFAVGKHFF